MGGPQIKRCVNCRFSYSSGKMTTQRCEECLVSPMYSNWQTKRGSKAGAKRKPGAGRTPFEDQGEKKQAMILSFKENDVTKAGGYKKVKADLEKAFYDKINNSI